MNLPRSVCIDESRVIGIRQPLSVHCLNSLTSTALRTAAVHPVVDQYGVSTLTHLITSHMHLFHSLIRLLLIDTWWADRMLAVQGGGCSTLRENSVGRLLMLALLLDPILV